MKFKTTRKAIVEGSTNIRQTGYCALCFLLYFHKPIAYTCGIYGWNFDVYSVYGLTITTGYRNMAGKPLANVSEYNQRAQAIVENYSLSRDERKQLVDGLLHEFCKENGGN